MPTSYSTLLGLALPVTGELSGTWGDEVNNYITQYLDSAVAGTQTISGSQTAVTLSKTTNASLSQAGSGATGSSQYQIINCTGNPGSLLTVTAPAASKAYLILNNTSTNQSVKIVGTGPTTGVTIAATRCALVAWNGSDFELVASTDASQLTGVLAVANGGTGATTLTGYVYGNGTSAFTASTSIPNSATTATSANTASAIVARDGSGNFSAGTITATLSGTATQVSNSLTLATSGTGLSGSATFNGSSAQTFTVSSNATSANTGSTIVARDASGNFSAGTITATLSGNATNVSGVVAVANGGTGLSSTPANGALDIGNGSGFTRTTLTAGSGVSISNGAGAITISATGSGGTVTSVATAGTVNGITLTGGTITSSGTITLGGTLSGVSLTSQVTGTLPIANGGTGTTSTTFVNLTTNVTGTLPVANGGTGATTLTGVLKGNGTSAFTAGTVSLTSEVAGTLPVGNGGTGATSLTANNFLLGNGTSAITASSLLQVSGSYIRPVAYADTVVAAGNTGTALTLTCTQGNVFTATLTGNATITLSSPIATGSTSITLILTNDGTAGRTVAWAGGSFVFPGGAASLSRTTTANAIDVWVFFTPNGGTTWYGNIAMKNMTA